VTGASAKTAESTLARAFPARATARNVVFEKLARHRNIAEASETTHIDALQWFGAYPLRVSDLA
jgi:hypothetical protein